MAKPGVPTAGGGDFTELPEMTFIVAKINDTTDPPTIEQKAFKDEEPKPQLKVVFDAIYYVDEEGDKVDVQGSRAWFFGGVSLHEKAKLRPLALAVMPEDTTLDVLTDEQKADKSRKPNLFEDFDTDMLAGKYVQIIGTYPDPNDKKYLKITGFKRVKSQPNVAKVEAKPTAKKLATEAIEV